MEAMKKNYLISLAIPIFIGKLFGGPAYSRFLSLNFTAPDIRAYLTDSSGRRTGIDPAVELDSVGQQQVNGKDYQLVEIPNSNAEQNNLDEGQPRTGWEIGMREPSGAFVFNYSSDKQFGAGIIGIDLMDYSSRKLSSGATFLVAQKGSYKQLRISVGAATGLTITPVINDGDFLKDTQAACGINAISPSEACEVLEDLASNVEKAKSEGNSKVEADRLEIYLLVLNRLHNWSVRGFRKNWDDLKDHQECDRLRKGDLEEAKFFAKDPGYSAFKLDAETLLNALPKNDGDEKGKHDSGGKDAHKD
jgi:hypothetical protein